MRVLIVGAGAVGGYVGGRLMEAGRDVTFLVRPRRRAQLAETGLVLTSPLGDFHAPAVTVLTEEIHQPFDVVLLSCKAYDLAGALDSLAPAVGPATAILPLLNGMAHLPSLVARFGSGPVLGGLCSMATTVTADGAIRHLNDLHMVVFGERDGGDSARVQGIAAVMAPAKLAARSSPIILQEMWEKWVFLASLAGITCLMRASIGDIVAAGGTGLAESLLAEAQAVAGVAGFAARPPVLANARAMLTQADSTLTASMLRDVEKGGATEADHVLGDLLRRGQDAGLDLPLLRLAHTHLAAYAARRRREG